MRPLEDVRVLAVEQYGAGPFGSLHLADLGADVIKIEDPATAGDVGRYVPPFNDGEDSLFFQTFNRDKRSLSLDLTNPSGRELFHALVARSDAVYSNLRGDIPARLGITYADLAEHNPRIVCCSLSGYGMTGPRAKDPAYDYMLQGLAGWMSLTGEPGGPPTKTGLSLVDYLGGVVAACSLVAGVHAARRDGVGMDCDLSLFDVAVSMLTYPATWLLNRDYEVTRTRHSAHPSLVPFQNFATRDGWIVVGCAKEKFWQRLVEVIGRPDLAADPRFVDFARRRDHADALLPIVEQAFGTDTSAAWLARLTEAGVPCAPIQGLREALDDPHTRARGLVVEARRPDGEAVRVVRTAVAAGPVPVDHRAAPARGADGPEVLAEVLGYDAARITALDAAGAFGPPRD